MTHKWAERLAPHIDCTTIDLMPEYDLVVGCEAREILRYVMGEVFKSPHLSPEDAADTTLRFFDGIVSGDVPRGDVAKHLKYYPQSDGGHKPS